MMSMGDQISETKNGGRNDRNGCVDKPICREI